MKRYWVAASVGLLAVGLVLGAALALPGAEAAEKGPAREAGKGGPGGPGLRGGPMVMKRLEEAMGKPMADDQRQQMRAAAEALHESIKAAHEAFQKKVSEITGVPIETLKEILPPPPPPGERGPRGPGQGGEGGERPRGPRSKAPGGEAPAAPKAN